MRNANQGFRRRNAVLVAAALGAATLLGARQADATLVTLIDDNSSASFDTQTQNGMFNWTIDGTSVLKKQWFWYRVGNVAEQSIDTLNQTLVGATDSNFDGNNDVLFVRYAAPGNAYTVETRYSLDGGSNGSGVSDLGEQISVKNLTAGPLDFHFFQYVDLDLSGADTVFFPNANTVHMDGAGGFTATEAVQTPVPSHREPNLFPATITKLNDGVATTLNDVAAAGPGDATWALQWDVTIAAGDTFIISKDKLVSIPEPASLALLGLATSAFAMRRRRA